MLTADQRSRLTAFARSADAVFVYLLFLVAAIAVLLGNSAWLEERLQGRINVADVVETRIGDHSEYTINLSCFMRMSEDSCESSISFDYTITELNPASRIVVLIKEFNGDIALTVNEKFEYATKNMAQLFRIVQPAPILVDLPISSLNVGFNKIEFSLRSSSILGGYLSQVFIGSREELEAKYARGVFLRSSIPLVFGGALFLFSMIMGYLGLRHRDETFVVCAIACITFSFGTIYEAMPYETSQLGVSLVRMLKILGAPFFAVIIYSASLQRYPVSVITIFAFPAMFLIFYFSRGSGFEKGVVALCFWGFFLLMVIHAVISTIYNNWHSGKRYAISFSVVAFVGVIGGVSTYLSVFGFSTDTGDMFRGFVPVFFFALFGLVLVKQFSEKSIKLEHANQEMAKEIAQVKLSLQESFKRDEEYRRSKLIEKERQRLMGDLHDGLAGNLISIKALAADTEEDSLPKINDLARLALLDLRLVVESLDSFDGDLAAVLAAFRERILPQYQQTEPQLTWDFSDAPHLEGLTPEINLGIFRILQEALANAFRHGNARHIRVTARSMRGAPDVALILVADDGKPDRTAAPGFGIRNMRRRAASIGAGMRIMFTERGTAVILRIRASGRERNEVAISKNG